jgi:SAM-dependent methyltransferase
MPDPTPANAAQIDYWNTTAGLTWAALQAQLDRQIEPLGARAMDGFKAQAGETVLDIGCGCGQTTLALAERVGPDGAVTGADISRPMLEVARARTAPAVAARPRFVEIDAQTGDLGQGVFDGAFSRFGVMFFADPVAAFANIGRSLKPQGRLTFVCWRPYLENPWMRTPAEAAAPLLPAPSGPAPDPHAPGPFAFADPVRVWDLLEGAGFRAIEIRPFDATVGGGTLEETVALSFRVGPLGLAMRDNPHLAEPVAEVVRAAIAPYETPAGVLMPAAVWIVRAGWP